ncbi:MAG TPA: penicillin-binding protein 2 [Candidatus Limnocylindria bacterium]|nr:penicillin-binding protein 2 [Candidatus Limnocylindria bacterium]
MTGAAPLADLDGRRRDLPRSRRRFIAFGLLGSVVICLLLGRLYELQVLRGAGRPSADLRTHEVPVPATRGLVFDRVGRPVAVNAPSWTVNVRPADLPDAGRRGILRRVAAVTGADPAALRGRVESWTGSPYDLVPLVHGVERRAALLLSEQRDALPGVVVEVEPVRRYLDDSGEAGGPLLSQVLGHTGAISAEELAARADAGYLPDDRVGKAGVEASYEDALRGRHGSRLVEVDVTGRPGSVVQENAAPVPGKNLMLTVDARAQRLATRALAWGMEVAGVRQGVLIAMDPQTGEILALVSLPAYDNNVFATGIDAATFERYLADPGQPLRNHAVSDVYPPGSTYKLVTALAALEEGVTDASRRWPTYGCYQIPGAPKGQCLFDWNRRGFGAIDIVDAFAVSSDTFFYQMAVELGVDRLARWAGELGFGEATGIALPAEAAGVVPSSDWAEEQGRPSLFTGELAQAGIGQNVTAATPLQVLNAYAAVANGGRLLRPALVRGETDARGELVAPYRPELLRRLAASDDHLRTLRIAAREVITSGHAYNIGDLDLPGALSGKTGTAEFGAPTKEGTLPFHSWFVAYLPSEPGATDAELAVMAFSHSAVVPGNVSAEVVKYWLQLWYGLEQDLRLDPRTFELVAAD